MKITNVKVELFDWTTEPWKTNDHTQFGSTVQLGVVTVETDQGINGNAFLGSSRVGANHHAPGLIEFTLIEVFSHSSARICASPSVANFDAQ